MDAKSLLLDLKGMTKSTFSLVLLFVIVILGAFILKYAIEHRADLNSALTGLNIFKGNPVQTSWVAEEDAVPQAPENAITEEKTKPIAKAETTPAAPKATTAPKASAPAAANPVSEVKAPTIDRGAVIAEMMQKAQAIKAELNRLQQIEQIQAQIATVTAELNTLKTQQAAAPAISGTITP